jgi:hypothetical protein
LQVVTEVFDNNAYARDPSLMIVPAQLRSFQTEYATEGKVANDDGTTTPLVSKGFNAVA